MFQTRLNAQFAAALAHGLDGIGENIPPGLLQQTGIGEDMRAIVGKRFFHAQVIAPGNGRGQRALHGHDRIDARETRLAVAADLQEILHQGADACALLADHARQLGALLRCLVGLVEQRRRGIDHADWIADLMRERRRQFTQRHQLVFTKTLLLFVVRLAQARGHGVKCLGQVPHFVIARGRHLGIKILRGELHHGIAQLFHRPHHNTR